MQIREISARAIERKLWQPVGETPWGTLNSDIRTDIERATAQGRASVFARSEGGYISIAIAGTSGPAVLDCNRVERAALKMELLERARTVHPRRFEELIGELIRRMGYQDVVVTPYFRDGGVDVTARFPCGPITDRRFVFQAKRWRNPVGQRAVRELRGVLEPDEQGVLMTTSSFSASARRLSERWGHSVVLIGGDELADLLIRHDLGVRRVPTERVTLVGFDSGAW